MVVGEGEDGRDGGDGGGVDRCVYKRGISGGVFHSCCDGRRGCG